MFNVNSTSVDAWKAVLGNLKRASVPRLQSDGSIELVDTDTVPVSRTTVAGANDGEVQSDPEIANIATFNELDDAEIEALAEQVVREVKLRGPFLSFSEFVNRQLSDNTDLALSGTIESALNRLSEGEGSANPYEEIQGLFEDIDLASSGDATHAFPEAARGHPAYGFPGWVRQADILRSLAPVMSVRDDTFRIRAYGSTDDSEAWCEAIVQRKADYVDAQDESTIAPSDSTLSELNQRLGRKFEIISFRWLSPDEI